MRPGPEAFSGHTTRSTFITLAVRAQVRIDEIKRVTKHKNIEMFMRYVRDAQGPDDNPAGKIGL